MITFEQTWDRERHSNRNFIHADSKRTVGPDPEVRRHEEEGTHGYRVAGTGHHDWRGKRHDAGNELGSGS